MRLNVLVKAQIYRTSLELAFHDAKTLLDLPTTFVDADDVGSVGFQIGADRIETVEGRFLGDDLLIQLVKRFAGHLALVGAVGLGNEALIIVGIDFGNLASAILNGLNCPIDLPFPDAALVISIG